MRTLLTIERKMVYLKNWDSHVAATGYNLQKWLDHFRVSSFSNEKTSTEIPTRTRKSGLVVGKWRPFSFCSRKKIRLPGKSSITTGSSLSSPGGNIFKKKKKQLCVFGSAMACIVNSTRIHLLTHLNAPETRTRGVRGERRISNAATTAPCCHDELFLCQPTIRRDYCSPGRPRYIPSCFLAWWKFIRTPAR